MKIKTNLRAGAGADNTTVEDVSGQKQKQNGGGGGGGGGKVVYTRCAGL